LNNRKNDESWQETLEILRDPESMKRIREGRADAKAGRLCSKEEVLRKMYKKHRALKTVEKNLSYNYATLHFKTIFQQKGIRHRPWSRHHARDH